MDLWLVCEDGGIEKAQEEMTKLLKSIGMCSSDINPIASIELHTASIIGVKLLNRTELLMLNLSKNSLALWQKPLSRYGEFLTDY